jgi:hypothetical protein
MQTATPDWRSDSLWQKQPSFLHAPISNSHLSPWLNFISPMAFANLKTLELKFSAEPQHCHHRSGALEERRGCAQRIKTNIIQTARTFASLATRCQLRELTLEFPVGLIQVLIYHGEIEDLEGMCYDIIRLVYCAQLRPYAVSKFCAYRNSFLSFHLNTSIARCVFLSCSLD